jgi:hypothetical protein
LLWYGVSLLQFPIDLNVNWFHTIVNVAHLYGLPKVHKPDIPLRPIVSSIGSPCYALVGFLCKILCPLAGKSESFVKNLSHFV